MRFLRRFFALVRSEWEISAIIALALLLRIAGIHYGLPLSVVADETPFTHGALQMIQSKTLIPAMNPEVFANILPYPPYISYVLLLPFVAILGVQYMLFSGSNELFTAQLLSDLTPFFLTARLLNVVLGVASVYLVYRIAEALFRSRVAALASGFFVATSVLHIALSMVGRNWIPTSLAFLLVVYILTRENIARERRYLYATIVAGVGMGISALCALSLVLIALYYLFLDGERWKNIRNDAKYAALSLLAFLILAPIPTFLHHTANKFLVGVSWGGKFIAELFTAPIDALALVAPSEPLLLVFALVGLALLFKNRWRPAVYLALWILVYLGVFFVFFRFEPRFLLPLIPFLALCAGYGASFLWERRAAIIVVLLLIIPLAASVQLSLLAIKSDMRTQTRAWVLTHLSPQDRVLVYGYGLRLPMNKESVEELREIDERVLSRTDEADALIDRNDIPHSLNLSSLKNSDFLNSIREYARGHDYEYLVISEFVDETSENREGFDQLIGGAEVLQRFEGLGYRMSIADSDFREPLTRIFSGEGLGPDVIVYRLP